MGFWRDVFLGAGTYPAQETRSLSIADPTTAFLLGYATPGSPPVGEYKAMTLSAVYRAASIVAGSIGGLPMRTMTYSSKGQTTVSSSFIDTPGEATVASGVRMTPFEWKELCVLHLLLHGNVYLQHIRNGAGAIVALNPIHPLQVSVEWDESRYGGKVFKVTQDNGHVLELDAHDITHIPGMSFDGLQGMSVISLARLSLGTALSGDKAANRQFTNGAMISGLVTPDGDQKLTPDDAKIIKDHINRTMTGAENAGDIPVINRQLRFTPWTLSAQDAQFLESRTFQIDEIGRWFGVPPHLLGLTEKSTSWGQGIAEQNRGLSRYTLSNITNRVQERLTTLLPPGRWVEFDYTMFVKPSPEDEINLLIDQVNSGLLTLNEARAIRNLPPLPFGDLSRLPAGSLPPDMWFPSDGEDRTPGPAPAQEPAPQTEDEEEEEV